MMAAEFGATAWGRAWLRTIESTATAAPNAQLPQARSLARGGAVTLALVQLIDEEPALAVRLRSDASLATGSSDPHAREVSDWVPLSEVDPATFYG